jgi:hypothetical protein
MNARRANVLRHPSRSDRDDLTGVENSLRVEYLLEFAKHVYEWAVLFGQERRATQAVAVLAADCAAKEPHLFVELGSERFHCVDVGIGAQIQKRPDVQLALGRMAEDGGCDLQMLERVLQVPQKNWKSLDGDGDIFDARRRPRRALHAMERRNEPLGQPPKQLKVNVVLCNVRRGGQA